MQSRTPHHPITFAFILCLLTLAALIAMASGGTASARPTRSAAAQNQSMPPTSSVVINEVYDASNPTNNNNEYIEIFNNSGSLIQLEAYTIYTRDGSISLGGLPVTITHVEAGQYTVFTPRDFINAPTVSAFGFASTDMLALKSSTSEDPVDVVNWGDPPNPGWRNFYDFRDSLFFDNVPTMPSADGSRSLSRYPNGSDTNGGTDWQSLLRSGGRANQIATPTPGSGTATPTASICQDRYEPDDSFAQALTIEPNIDQVHTLCKSTGVKDRDFMTFPAVGGKLYTMLTKDLTSPVDTVITLYNSSFNVLRESDDYPGQGLASRIDWTFTSSGIYYLQVRDKRSNGGLGYQYTVSLIATGETARTSTPTSTPTRDPNETSTPGTCFDAYEPDGVPETARQLLIGTSQRHSICPAVDADWERFYARAGKVYTVRTGNLGVGLDTYMYIFDSDARTILAQNDDGGDSVASRIDFYPLRDDWYFVQVKNAGDIGGPEQTYELSLAVVPGVPQPPSTATSIIAPPFTGTPAIPTATRQAEPTKPPVPTPTQGQVQATPTPRPTRPAQLGSVSPPSEEQINAQSLEEGPVIIAGEESLIPGLPNTGQPLVNPSVLQPNQTGANPAPVKLAPMLFHLFYDINRNRKLDKGEGIRGIQVLFVNKDAAATAPEQLVTSETGSGKAKLPVTGHKVYIPYLGINIELNKFPERELHSLWLSAVELPNRVP